MSRASPQAPRSGQKEGQERRCFKRQRRDSPAACGAAHGCGGAFLAFSV